jgi:uncharacterized membrane protein YfcA
MTLLTWAGLAATCFAAALLQATNGFGFAVLAVPFFLLLVPADQAIQLVIILSLAISLVMIPHLRAAIDPRLLLRLTAGSAIGLPIGLVAFGYSNPLIVRLTAGVVIVLFAAMMLGWNRYRRRPPLVAMHLGLDLGAGTIAGAATGLVGMPGPPLMIYLMLAAAPMRAVRATLVAFFVLVYAATLLSDVVFLGVPMRDWAIAASLLPLTWGGGIVGLNVAERLNETVATILSILVLAVAGLYTLAAAASAALY